MPILTDIAHMSPTFTFIIMNTAAAGVGLFNNVANCTCTMLAAGDVNSSNYGRTTGRWLPLLGVMSTAITSNLEWLPLAGAAHLSYMYNIALITVVLCIHVHVLWTRADRNKVQFSLS